ncbi:unnamed protein product [Diatraea saccharalis]|uniref:Uncharacterized protein n=1 Tax=Diatraea saccharalis TaxID=40085 RepID=A0A9N9WEM5_9NEOP|nr:unnamed protein product [Diatraea saccharalis]
MRLRYVRSLDRTPWFAVLTSPPLPDHQSSPPLKVYDYVNNDGTAVDSCEPLSPTLTASRTGQKAWDKCVEYQQTYVYTCDKGVDLVGSASRTFHCHHNTDDLIVGGEDAKEYEFPHMVHIQLLIGMMTG